MSATNIFLYVSGLIVLKKAFEGILDASDTKIISIKAVEALKDTFKKRLIDKSFHDAKQLQIKTGVYVSPQLEL